MNAILNMSSFISPLITFPYISRVLHSTGVGKVYFVQAVINYFGVFAQLGIPIYGIRACAKVRDHREELTRTAHELLMINLIMDLITYLGLGLSIIFIPKLREEKMLLIITSTAILMVSIGMEWLYKALEQYTYITIRSLIVKVIAMVAMFLLVHEEADYIIYGAISVFAASASNIYNLINVHKYIDLKKVGNYQLKKHLKPVAVFFAMSCATTVYTNLDTLMLGFMSSDTEVGFYNAAVKIKILLVSVVTSLGAVLLPRASYYIKKGKTIAFQNICNKAIRFVWFVAAPTMIYFMIYAKESILFLSGSDFTGSIVPMQCILPTILCIGLSDIMGIQILVPMGKEKLVLYSEVLGAVIDFLLNLILIPKFQASGAAIATVAAELAVLLFLYFYVSKTVQFFAFTRNYAKLASALLVALGLGLFMKLLPVGPFLKLCISACIYFSAYLIVLIVMKEELVLELLGSIWNMIMNKLN